jgi:hypothetical protein
VSREEVVVEHMAAARGIWKGIGALALAGAVAFCAASAQAGQLTVGAAPGSLAGGDSFTVQVSLNKAVGESLASVSLDLDFAPENVAPESCQLEPAAVAAGKSVVQRIVRPGLLRVGVYGLNTTTLPDGVVFRCGMRAKTFSPPGSTVLAGASEGALANGASAAMTAGFAQVDVAIDGDNDGILVVAGLPHCAGGNKTGCSDNCPGDSNFNQADSDGDGVGNVCDICQGDPNPPGEGGAVNEQLDTNRNGVGNRCDCDFNGDGSCGVSDMKILMGDYAAGVDRGVGTDMDGNNAVDLDDYRLFIRSLAP